MFGSKISAGAMEKLPVSEKSDANTSTWSNDVEGVRKARWSSKGGGLGRRCGGVEWVIDGMGTLWLHNGKDN